MDIFRNRVTNGFWVVNKRNPNFKSLKEGGRAILYLGGKEGKIFLGRCLITSQPLVLTPELRHHVRTQPSATFEHYIRIGQVELWEAKPLLCIVDKLKFIRDKQRWMNYLQGGLRKIPEEDYLTIANSTES